MLVIYQKYCLRKLIKRQLNIDNNILNIYSGEIISINKLINLIEKYTVKN